MIRDVIVVENAQGQQLEYGIEGLFEMDEQSYVLLTNEQDDMIMMRVEGEGEEQELVGIEDPEELESLIDAYEIAVDAAPAEEEQE